MFCARVKAAISIHSYGNVLIMPWGYDDIAHEEAKQMTRMAYKMVNAVKWGTKDRAGNIEQGTCNNLALLT